MPLPAVAYTGCLACRLTVSEAILENSCSSLPVFHFVRPWPSGFHDAVRCDLVAGRATARYAGQEVSAACGAPSRAGTLPENVSRRRTHRPITSATPSPIRSARMSPAPTARCSPAPKHATVGWKFPCAREITKRTTRIKSGERQQTSAGPGISVPLDDDADVIRRSVWLETDSQYRAAAEALIKIKTGKEVKVDSVENRAPDFSHEAAAYLYRSSRCRSRWTASRGKKKFASTPARFANLPRSSIRS